MRTIQQWFQRWQDRRIVRARLARIQAEREAAEQASSREALDKKIFALMRRAA